jgi:CRP-like cAMP-binding protein
VIPHSFQKDDERFDTKIEILKRSTLFSCLDRNELKEIAPLADFRHFDKGEFIFHEGDPPKFLYVVSSGKVKQFKLSASGRAFTTAMMSSGDPLNAVAIFGAKAHLVSAQALNKTVALCIGRENFLAFVDKYPIVGMKLIPLLGKVLNSAWERLTDFAGEMVCQRVFNVLYMLYFKFGDAIPVTREEIADMAGTTPETTVRMLSRLKRLGIIDPRRGKIAVLNGMKLRELSGCSYLISHDESGTDRY